MFVRTSATLAAVAAAMALAISFRTPPSPSLGTAAAPPPAASSSQPASTPTSTPSGAPPSGGGSPTPTAVPTPKAGTLKNGTFTGQSFPNFYGPVQVQLVVSGGRITNVKTLQSPNDNPQSAYIASVALPYLRQEVLQAQSAQINAVSGATFDSQSYAQSVQSALDAARA
ncbi:MAG: FMN-binding protein [Candidatus Dormibacteria bacterium]